ncbi:hypothetical protein AVEN_220774-1 [Araneus ventricosus]|uniref:Uncharacterized protein n=1 Tax=Araneus ventricosus TaxID=182803 RepID=A0A4Y2INJ8_ARAVE|nr:hypothetical protein AVEN_220774-1 [Araneus ventricosus]
MLLYTNTDSFIYDMLSQNVYNDMKNIIQEFDTYEYPENNIFGIPAINKKVPGRFKDENHGIIMTELIGLRSKMYANKVKEQGPVKKLKSVKKSSLQKNITFED